MKSGFTITRRTLPYIYIVDKFYVDKIEEIIQVNLIKVIRLQYHPTQYFIQAEKQSVVINILVYHFLSSQWLLECFSLQICFHVKIQLYFDLFSIKEIKKSSLLV